MKNTVILSSIILVGVHCTIAVGTTIYVDTTKNGDGSDWTNAYGYLQDALAAASSGDKIWVAEGIYKPDRGTRITSGDRTATFQLKNGVALYGGFPPGGGQWEDRNPVVYETILSGDLNGNDGPDFVNNGENSYHVVTGSGTDETVLLDGFTVTSGNANNSSWYIDRAGGMYIRNGSPTVANCTFIGNSAYRWGGGMCCYDGGRARIINCTFVENSASWGGGMCNNGNVKTILINCTFSENSASSDGGGMYNRSTRSWPYVTLNNCIFIGNSAGHGGGMYNRYGAKPRLINCTFTGNSSNWGGGIGTESTSNLFLTNCILWGNTAGIGSQLAFGLRSNLYISYCDLQSGQAGISLGDGSINWGQGNIDSDPLLALDGYHLLADSPCINAGDPNYEQEWKIYIENEAHYSFGPGLVDLYRRNVDISTIVVTDYTGLVTYTESEDYEIIVSNEGIVTLEILPGSQLANGQVFFVDYMIIIIPGYEATDLDGQPRIFLGRVDIGADEFVPSLEVPMHFTPRMLNPKSKGKWIKAHFILPESFTVDDVNTNSPARIVEPFVADSNYMDVFLNEDGLVEIEAAFDRADFCSNGPAQGNVVVIGRLTNGQYFYGTDTIRIKTNNLEYLAVLTSHWLEAGCVEPDWCEGADLNRDSVVDFIDFAFFDGCCLEFIKN